MSDLVLGFDAGGITGPAVLSTTSPYNGWLIRQMAQADPYVSGSSAITAFANSGTDFGHAFKYAGFSGYAFDLYWDRRIHTSADNINNINPSSIQHQGYHALSLGRYFANLKSLEDPREPDSIYFSVLRLFIVVYSSSMAIPIALIIIGAFGTVIVYGLRGGILSWVGMGYSSLIVLAGLILAPLPGILIDRSMPGVPLRFIGRALDQPWQIAVMTLISITLVLAWYYFSNKIRITSFPDLTIGALLPMLIGMIGTSIAFPTVSFIFSWPLIFSFFAFILYIFWHIHKESSKMLGAGFVLSGIAILIILGPTILLGLFDQMSISLILLGILCGFLLPLVQLMKLFITNNWR